MNGEQLADIRRQKKLTQQQLAEQIGVKRQRISEWENGVFSVSPYYKRKLKIALG